MYLRGAHQGHTRLEFSSFAFFLTTVVWTYLRMVLAELQSSNRME